MADASQVWRDSAGTSRQKTIRIIWPELADALDGKAETVTVMPTCAVCGKRPGRIVVELPTGEHLGVCGLDVGLSRFHGLKMWKRP